MFLHLGNDVVVPYRDVVAIYDMDTTTISKISREFLAAAEIGGLVENVSEELPKSYILCEKDKKKRIYVSPISSVTLHKRFDELFGGKVNA